MVDEVKVENTGSLKVPCRGDKFIRVKGSSLRKEFEV